MGRRLWILWPNGGPRSLLTRAVNLTATITKWRLLLAVATALRTVLVGGLGVVYYSPELVDWGKPEIR
jgi:hypothetical protein